LRRANCVINQLASRLPASERHSVAAMELASYGCRTTMHVVRLLAPQLDRETHTEDIDFSPGASSAGTPAMHTRLGFGQGTGHGHGRMPPSPRTRRSEQGAEKCAGERAGKSPIIDAKKITKLKSSVRCCSATPNSTPRRSIPGSPPRRFSEVTSPLEHVALQLNEIRPPG
jgi:hypothetical protein